MHQDSSVWPGYVAAVASLVLSLLLLAAVMVFSITQIGSAVSDYNERLISVFIEDELRITELETLSKEIELATAKLSDVRNSSKLLERFEEKRAMDQEKIKALEEELSKKIDDVDRLRLELSGRYTGFVPMDDLNGVVMRFVFGHDQSGLNESVIQQIKNTSSESIDDLIRQVLVIEAGVKGLDVMMRREVYRLVVTTRNQLISNGIVSNSAGVLLNDNLSPHELLRSDVSIDGTGIPVVVRVLSSKSP